MMAESIEQAPAADHRRREAFNAVLLAALSAYVISCGLWIEVLNERTGRILPRELRPGVNNKWRIAATSILERQNASPEEIQRNRDASRLKDAVGSFGLLQYLLCPFAMLWGMFCLVLPARFVVVSRIIGLLAMLAGAGGLYLATTRQYFESLGW